MIVLSLEGGPVPYDVQVTIDALDPHALADWWSDALGWAKGPSDETFVRRMLAEGYATEQDVTTHNGVLVFKGGAGIHKPDGSPPRIHFQLVREAKTVKDRVHLDLRIGTDDVEATVTRLEGAGAVLLYRGQQGPHTWVTMADPEGNEFCVSQ